MRRTNDRPVFLFLNIGETHILTTGGLVNSQNSYYYQGARWPSNSTPCVLFGRHNDAEEYRRRKFCA